ncbi:dirigent protein 21-like [Henckelia pumila]|uniref:dirigent protein 21-like n=1 Tax=Henckelia pumila TaxID=405737 RepID=UPI003C6DCB25
MDIKKLQHCILLVLLSMAISANGKDIATESQALENWLKAHCSTLQNLTKLQLYVRDIFSAPVQSNQVVATADSTFKSPTLFGLVSVLDDPITVGPESGSAVLGQAQGLIVFSSLEKISLHMTLTLVFTSGPYNGSSLNLVGHNPYLEDLRRVPIVGGTGAFLLAQGVTLIHTVSSNSSGDAILQYDVYILHY